MRTGASADRRAVTVFAASAAVWILVLLQVDRTDQHVEVREARWWQVLAFAFGMLGSAAAVHLAAACYFVMLLFR